MISTPASVTKVIIKRQEYMCQAKPKQTLGTLTVKIGAKELFTCKTLELPWKENNFRVSCIPTGTYQVIKRTSAKYANHFHLENVPGRDMILIHHGNYLSDTLGCIIVGKAHTDINGDGLQDVTSSKDTMKLLNSHLPKSFTLVIQ